MASLKDSPRHTAALTGSVQKGSAFVSGWFHFQIMCLIYFLCFSLQTTEWCLNPHYLSWKSLFWHSTLWKHDKKLLLKSIYQLYWGMRASLPQWRPTFGRRRSLSGMRMRMYSPHLFDHLYDNGWLSSLLNPLMYRFHPQNIESDIDSPYWHEVRILRHKQHLFRIH